MLRGFRHFVMPCKESSLACLLLLRRYLTL